MHEALECPKCGVPVRHVAGSLALCAICGHAIPVRKARRTERPSIYDGLDLDRLREERRRLRREAARCRLAMHRPERLVRRLAVGGAVAVFVLVGLVLFSLVVAFKLHGNGQVNLRYVTAYGTILSIVGVLTVSALVWSACDPNTPFRLRHLERLDAARRAIREVEERIGRIERDGGLGPRLG